MAEPVVSILSIAVMGALSASHAWHARFELAFAWFLAFFYGVIAYGVRHG